MKLDTKTGWKLMELFDKVFKLNILSPKLTIFQRYIAFTIAEVLIVLGIIGIVAEMTIPDLVASYQNQVYLTSFKKSYSELNQVLEKMAADNGCPGDLSCTDMVSGGNVSAGPAFVKYFKVSKDCGTAGTEKCWSDKTNENFDGTSASFHTMNSAGSYKFITADGMSFSLDSGSCLTLPPSAGYCGEITVDTNGLKGPNNDGIDVFWFEIHQNGSLLVPQGSNKALSTPSWSAGNWCSKGNPWGYLCAGRIVEKSFDMDYLD